MKLIFTSLCLFFFGITSAKCQDTLLTKRYPFTIVTKVNDVSSVINLTIERKLTFASFFKKNSTQWKLQCRGTFQEVQFLS